MLKIHRAERADALVGALGEVLRHPKGDPFRPERVAVPSMGVERWLAQQLSHVLGAGDAQDGVCANVLFPPYALLLDETAAEADADYAHAIEQWDAERSVWPLMRVIDRVCATESWATVLAAHLGLDGSGDKGRRFAVAGKLARLFDRYGRARPDLVLAWRDGRDEQGDGTPLPSDLVWQAELWRVLRTELGTPAPAELLDSACGNIGAGEGFSVFGATRISPARLQILAALARTRDIHLWLHHPSPALWRAVHEENAGTQRRRDQLPVVRHPLLAGLSRDVRELQQLLEAIPHEDEHHAIAARPDTLLGRIQDELAHDRVPAHRAPIAPDDHSLRVHAAHGPARQVEIVREAILGLLAEDPTLEPRDILIMCPDVEAYAPLVAASFGMTDETGAHPAALLRVKLADRSLRQTNPLLGLLAQLLDLAASRVSATQLLDLAGSLPVRRKFGFDADDVERLRAWTVGAGARWGLDAHHRDTYRLGGIAQGTWRSALDRLLLGVAMEDGGWVGTALPLDDVDSGDIELVGAFAELVDRVEHAVRTLSGQRGIGDWVRLLIEATLDLGEGEQAWQAMQLRRELEDVADAAGEAEVELGLADLTALLHARLAGRPSRASFRTGTLTVCTLVPMRSVPHRVVCLVGMDDGAFPRQTIADGDDVLAREPRIGERDIRSEDRQLFLDAVCAAQEHLLITYTGADPRSGAEVPPCVPLGELLDAIDATAIGADGSPARGQVVVHHPLQPFDRRNFVPGGLGTDGPFSFDPAGLAGARAAAAARVPARVLVAAPLESAPSEPLQLDDLVSFFQNPARGFLRQRLGISTWTGDDEPDDALPVELDGLQSWAIGDRVLQRCLAGAEPAVAARLEYLRGELPPGPLGERAMTEIGRRVNALMAASEVERETDARTLDISVPLDDGRILTGTVPGVRGRTVLTVTYASLGTRLRLTAWLRFLAAVASTDDGDHRAVTVGRHRDGARRATLQGVAPAIARQALGMLAVIRDAGLREPLPLALESSAEYASRRDRGDSVADAMLAARRRWLDDRFRPERDDPAHVLAFGAGTPFESLVAALPSEGEEYPGEPTRFGTLARTLWAPLQLVETVTS